MSEHIVGMMWNKNEGDILEEVIYSALDHVDSLVIADDGSTDNSWDIIQYFSKAHREKVEHIQQNPNKGDPAQRQQLLNVIRDRYKPEDTWVQIIESDIMILDTDIRLALKLRSNDVRMTWQLLNASPAPGQGKWDGIDEFPNWSKPIQDIMTHAHKLELMPYTFRPFKELWYSDSGPWRPWPKGFSKLSQAPEKRSNEYTPLLAHYGYRGPTHFYEKYKPMGKRHHRYPTWDLTSVESVKETVYFFNNTWARYAWPMSRYGWMNRKNRTKTEWVEGRGWGPRVNERIEP
jgi:glycosyltransferase involved in cell wall biosynthesis